MCRRFLEPTKMATARIAAATSPQSTALVCSRVISVFSTLPRAPARGGPPPSGGGQQRQCIALLHEMAHGSIQCCQHLKLVEAELFASLSERHPASHGAPQ